LSDRIRSGALAAEAVRVPIAGYFGHRIKRQEMQRLHRPIAHRGNAQRALPAARFRNVDPTQGQRSIASVVGSGNSDQGFPDILTT
jgi:hypothetical protein